MKTIYLNKEDIRSYALTPNVIWETIALQVPNDFEGGGKYYDLSIKQWIDDEIAHLPNEEIQEYKLLQSIEKNTSTLRD